MKILEKSFEDEVREYFNLISLSHSKTGNQSGFEKNDRGIFINKFLKLLGYDLSNILDDVSQKINKSSSGSPDIRIYSNNEDKSKQAHSQFILETKNFGLLKKNLKNIDYLQLKKYIVANKSKIRVICCTDYITLFVFNATSIRANNNLKINDLSLVSNLEIELFKNNLEFEINFDEIKDLDFKNLKNLSYDAIFKKHKFINPEDYKDTNDISDPSTRASFISSLFHLMKKCQNNVKPNFLESLNYFKEKINKFTDDISFKQNLIQEILKKESYLMKSYFFWGAEMNYLSNFISDTNISINKKDIIKFISDNEKQEAFILTSIYSLINKTFFLRILEDNSSDNTKFIQGAKNYRYLSNGILQDKITESEDSLIDYLKNIFEFKKNDLKQFSFLLKKDIYSWVLDYIDKYNFLEFIRLFNDINFSRLNQDILGDIYEHYLEQDKLKDQKSFRQILGQYYTPKPIVRLMWSLVRDVVTKTKNRDLFEKDKYFLDILDPCYGSGTFLCEAILQINQSAIKKEINSDGKVFGFIKDRNLHKKIEDHLYGFELNPLSKSIADVNIFFSLIQAYGVNSIHKNVVENLNIYRTDSFDLKYGSSIEEKDGQLPLLLELFTEDIQDTIREQSKIIQSKKKKYDIIIANPPYGHINPNEFMKRELIPFAYAENNFNKKGKIIPFDWDKRNTEGKVPEEEKNTGKIRDMYAFFFGIADKLVREGGVICFITSNTYLSAPTYKWIRKYWLENYKIHYIINFNKIGEKSNSMFAPEAGVATSIIVLEKTKPDLKDGNNIINYLELSQEKIPEKFDYFSKVEWGENRRNKNDMKTFKLKNLVDLNFNLINQSKLLNKVDYIFQFDEKTDIVLETIYNNTEELDHLLKMKCGIVTGGHEIFVAKTKLDIENKIKETTNLTSFSKLSKTLEGNFESKKEYLKSFKFDHTNIFPFVYERQILSGLNNIDSFVYYDKKLLWRAREEKDILCKNKLIVFNDRSNYKLFSNVTEETIIPEQSKRSHYYISDNLDSLYFISGILNSELMSFVYQENLGLRNFPIKKVKPNNSLYKKIVSLNKELHYIKKDQITLSKNQKNFKSSLFNNNLISKIDKVNILDDNEFWKVQMSEKLSHNYYISNPYIEKNEIILNEDIRLIFNSNEITIKLFELFLKNFDGDLQEEELIIDINEINENNINNDVNLLINEQIKKINEEINNDIYELYEVKKEESFIKSKINKSNI